SWGQNPYRYRLKWRCACGKGAYTLHSRVNGSLACAACAGFVPESRSDPMSADFRRLARLRQLLGVRDIYDDPNASKPPKDKPRSVWQWRRRVRDLRLLEQRIGWRLDTEAFELFIARKKPSKESS